MKLQPHHLAALARAALAQHRAAFEAWRGAHSADPILYVYGGDAEARSARVAARDAILEGASDARDALAVLAPARPRIRIVRSSDNAKAGDLVMTGKGFEVVK